MPNKLLPYKYEVSGKPASLTSFAGLPVFLDLFRSLHFDKVLRDNLDSADDDRLWKPSHIATSLLLLHLAGGDCVDDLQRLRDDPGISRLLGKFVESGLSVRALRRQRERKARQGCGSLPAASTVFRFLKQDGRDGLESCKQGKAYIPPMGKTAQELCACNKHLVSALCANREYSSITLDIDATLIETHKRSALYGYKGFAAYQPMNVWWAEQRMMLYTEFRDGNVPAGFGMQSVLERALSCLPEAGKPVYLRSDAAGYQIDLMKFCDDKKIQFAIGCPVSQELRKAVHALPAGAWQRLHDKRQYAELCFVPNSLATTKKDKYAFRYVVIREVLERQCTLFDMPEPEYPFPVLDMNGSSYKVHALVSNRDLSAPDLIRWYYGRCGNSEEAHAILKNDLAGGLLPSDHFHGNANWWWLTVIAHNIHSLFKQLCCDESWQKSRLKRIRFRLISLAGLVMERGRCLFIRLNADDGAYALLSGIRRAICGLRPCPG